MEPSAALPAWAASAATAIALAPAWVRATIPAAAEAIREAAASAMPGEASSAISVAVVLPSLGLVAASAAAGMAVHLACDGLSFQPGRAAIDPQRINPMAGLRRIFSWATLLGSAGHAAALVALVVVGVMATRPLAAMLSEPEDASRVGYAAWQAVMWLAAAAALLTIAQWFLAKRRFEGRIKMTPQEYAEEAKDLRADPRVRLMQQKRKVVQPTTSGTR
jgi:flagellar biosynthetic protein FlhB